jgi:hypothetical protein
MTRHMRCSWCLAMIIGCLVIGSVALTSRADSGPAAKTVELFEGMKNGEVGAKIVVMNDHEARVFLANQTKQPLDIQLPEAFAAVPAVAQFGGGGGGRSTSTSTGGGNQTSGGGFGGGGGGGGVFSIPPESTERLDVPVLCLNHGLRDPSSSKPYNLVPAESQIDRPAVIELLKAFGRGELQHNAAQAAAWHLNSDVSWKELSAKLTGTRRNFHRAPYFSRDELNAGLAYANEASRLAALHEREKESLSSSEETSGPDAATLPADENQSEERSTTDQ